MSSSQKKFNQRAPRFTLRPTDNRILRFANPDDNGVNHVMKVVDISMSGMSFVVDREHSPFIFDVIKVEIPLRAGQQVAWWAKVVRMEEYEPHKWYMQKGDFDDANKILIGVHFNDLPAHHAKTIQENLRQNFADLEKEKSQRYAQSMAWIFAKSTWQVLFYVGLTTAAVWTIWALSRPSENYDAEKGSPWGQRFLKLEDETPKDNNPGWDNSDSNPQRVPSIKDYE